jgi:hypothetical protein
MQFRRSFLTAIPAVGAVLAVSIASPPLVNADPQVGGCVNADGVSACANLPVNVPNINAVANAIPNIQVPNINVPHVFHGHW